MKITKSKDYHKQQYWILKLYNTIIGHSSYSDDVWTSRVSIPLEDDTVWRGEAIDTSIKKGLDRLVIKLQESESKPDERKLSDARPEIERIKERNKNRVGMSDLIGHPNMGRVKVASYIIMPKDKA